MGLFAGLEKFGLNMNLDEKDLFKVGENSSQKKEEASETEEREVQEVDLIFDKSYKCPVCDTKFISKTVKVGKAKIEGTDTDLRPRYTNIDALKYDAVVCPKCGFAAITRFFKATSSTQNKLIRAQISSTFKGIEEPEVYSYEDAITRHQLALVSTIVKRGKISERAYCCLKLAWLFRGKREHTENPEVCESLLKQEMDLLEKAYTGFTDAFSGESFPMCGMDELTVIYIVSDLARQLKQYDIALRWVSRIILASSANGRIKDKARDLKDQILEEKKQESGE